MADEAGPRRTSCLTCINRGRQCDGGKTICRACFDNGEQYCSWAVSFEHGVAPVGELANMQLPSFCKNTGSSPGTNRSVDIEWQLGSSGLRDLSWVRNSPNLQHLIDGPKSCNLLHFDPELQILFPIIDPGTDVGQEELAAAILNLVQKDPSSDAVSMEHHSAGIQAIRKSVQSASARTSSGAIGVAICLACVFDFYHATETRHLTNLIGLQQLTQSYVDIHTIHLPSVSRTVIKSLAYHTAIGSTFSFSRTAGDLPLSYITDLRQLLSTSIDTNEASNEASDESFLGLPLLLLDLLFRIAQARHEYIYTSLTQETHAHLVHMQKMLEDVDSWIDLDKLHANSPRTRAAQEQLLRLYWAAVVILLRKTIKASTKRSDVGRVVRYGLENVSLENITHHDRTAVWPLLILYFAGHATERIRIWDMLKQLQLRASVDKLQHTLEFLRHTDHVNRDSPDDIIEVLLQENVEEIILL